MYSRIEKVCFIPHMNLINMCRFRVFNKLEYRKNIGFNSFKIKFLLKIPNSSTTHTVILKQSYSFFLVSVYHIPLNKL